MRIDDGEAILRVWGWRAERTGTTVTRWAMGGAAEDLIVDWSIVMSCMCERFIFSTIFSIVWLPW